MGIRLVGSSCGCNQCNNYPYNPNVSGNNKSGNPNPLNFRIDQISEIKGFKLVVVNYPDCKNYEGDKILVYDKGISVEQIKNSKFLDPHFCDTKEHISPIARFKPDKDGMLCAIVFCENFDKK